MARPILPPSEARRLTRAHRRAANIERRIQGTDPEWEDVGTAGTSRSDPWIVSLQVSDPAAGIPLTASSGQAYFRVPDQLNGRSLISVAAHVVTVSSSGAVSIQVTNLTGPNSMLSTQLTIDASEHDSITAATPAVIDPSHKVVATADLLSIDVTAAGTSTQGLIVELQFQ